VASRSPDLTPTEFICDLPRCLRELRRTWPTPSRNWTLPRGRCRPTIALPSCNAFANIKQICCFANLPLLHKMGDEQHVDRVSVFLGYAELVSVFDDGGLVAVNNSLQYKLQVDTEL
jgi:hypothetical protein